MNIWIEVKITVSQLVWKIEALFDIILYLSKNVMNHIEYLFHLSFSFLRRSWPAALSILSKLCNCFVFFTQMLRFWKVSYMHYYLSKIFFVNNNSWQSSNDNIQLAALGYFTKYTVVIDLFIRWSSSSPGLALRWGRAFTVRAFTLRDGAFSHKTDFGEQV